MKTIVSLIPFVLIVLSWCLGYLLLKLKGYTSRWYILVPFAPLPVFWIVFGAAKTRNANDKSVLWSYGAVSWGVIFLAAIIYSQWNDIEQLSKTIAMIIITVFGVFGYMFLKLKGYTSWNYLALVISATPLFWIIFGLLRSNNERTPEKQVWSYVAVFWGFVLLFLSIKLKELV